MVSANKLELSPQLTKISFNQEENEYRLETQGAPQNGQRVHTQNAAMNLKLQSMIKF